MNRNSRKSDLQIYLAKTVQQNFQPGLFFNILKKMPKTVVLERLQGNIFFSKKHFVVFSVYGNLHYSIERIYSAAFSRQFSPSMAG